MWLAHGFVTETDTLQAAILLGLQHRSVPVSIKDNYSMRGEALREAIEQDVAAGLIPFFVGEALVWPLVLSDFDTKLT